MTETSGSKNKKTIIAVIAAIVVVAAAVVAAIMILKPQTLDEKFFVSDDTKLVYNVSKGLTGGAYDSNEIYMVYNYSGDTINKLTTYYGYEDEETAKAALDKYAEIFTPGDEIENVSRNGRFIVLVAKPYIYEGTTAESVRAMIDFQKESTEGLDESYFDEENIIEDADAYINW